MDKVQALIIGAQKAGTTSLYRYLSQHPLVAFSSVKEITYFIDAAYYARGPGYYHSFFPADTGKAVVTSAHVHMLPCPEAPARVQAYNPAMRFIVVLREPVARAWSAYHYARQQGWEGDEVSFEAALGLEPERLRHLAEGRNRDLVYIYNGLYAQHLRRWMAVFPRDRFLLLRSADLRNEPLPTLDRVWNFLGIARPAELDTSQEYNRASQPRWRWLNRLRHNAASLVPEPVRSAMPRRLRVLVRSRVMPLVSAVNAVELPPPELPAGLRARLAPYFSEDLQQLATEFGIRFD